VQVYESVTVVSKQEREDYVLRSWSLVFFSQLAANLKVGERHDEHGHVSQFVFCYYADVK